MKTIRVIIYDTGDKNFDIRNPDKLLLDLTVKILDSEYHRFYEMVKRTYFQSFLEVSFYSVETSSELITKWVT